MKPPISGATGLAAVVGDPVDRSLSPAIHNAWIAAAALDAIYVALAIGPIGFEGLVGGVAGAVRGLNVTAPFKERALALAARVSHRARRAGSANLLTFASEGAVEADNTDGEGLLAAMAEQAPGFDPAAGPVVILGAGGAARGAAAAFADAGAPTVWLVNRNAERAATVAVELGGKVKSLSVAELPAAIADAGAIINATPATPDAPLERVARGAVVMDMVYRPLETPFLARARSAGLATVDGLAMLIGQARPSFQTLFGVVAPAIDVRAVALAELERQR